MNDGFIQVAREGQSTYTYSYIQLLLWSEYVSKSVAEGWPPLCNPLWLSLHCVWAKT